MPSLWCRSREALQEQTRVTRVSNNFRYNSCMRPDIGTEYWTQEHSSSSGKPVVRLSTLIFGLHMLRKPNLHVVIEDTFVGSASTCQETGEALQSPTSSRPTKGLKPGRMFGDAGTSTYNPVFDKVADRLSAMYSDSRTPPADGSWQKDHRGALSCTAVCGRWAQFFCSSRRAHLQDSNISSQSCFAGSACSWS